MRFQFRLQRILEYFQYKETSKRYELAKVIQKIAALKQKKLDIEKEIQRLMAEQNKKAAGGIAWLSLYMNRSEANLQASRDLDVQIEQENELLKIKQKELNSITSRKKALESVKEKKEKEFRLERSRKEQRRLDETYQLRGDGKR